MSLKHTLVRFAPAAAFCVVLGLAITPLSAQPCVVPDDGSGTVQLPPAGCPYLSPMDVHLIIDGLPAGTTIQLAPIHRDFFCQVTPGDVCSSPPPPGKCQQPGGGLGGDQECAKSMLQFEVTGTGALSTFNRMISIPASFETHTGPRAPGDPVQSFDTDMFRLFGQLPGGDPDFDLLRITAGTGFGLPSPGHTTLTQLPGGSWNVDSFFDIEYRIDFVGAPGGPLAGKSGSTTATIRMQAGEPAPPTLPCQVADDGSGTVTLPPVGCDYLSPDEVHEIIDGLPAGTTIELAAIHKNFICNKPGTINPVCSFQTGVDCTEAGGSLGGEKECAQSDLELTLHGTGRLSGYGRDLVLPLGFETHTAPRTTGGAVQSFDTDMFRLFGQLRGGDPDFDLLRITAGTDFGMPSPGHTTLTQLPSGNWAVDSFFDIEYRIDFVGAPGGPLSGMSGSTTGTIRMQTGGAPPCPPIAGGLDTFPSTGKIVLETFPAAGGPIVVRVSDALLPAAVVQRGPQVGDTIPIELVQLTLSSSHPALGPITVQAGVANGLPPSLGRITGVVQDAGTCELVSGDSFFDVFVRIDLPNIGESWINPQPLRVERKIKRLPPSDEPFETPVAVEVLLVDQVTGNPRGEVHYVLHHADPPFPRRGNDCFDTKLDLLLTVPPVLFNSPVHVEGPTTVQRDAPQPVSPGACCNGGGSCGSDLDCGSGDTCCQTSAIKTELVEMKLTGNHPMLGPIAIQESPLQASLGQTTSQAPDRTYPANSFFGVFVELQGAMCNPCRNPMPAQVQGVTSGNPIVRNIPPDPHAQYRSQPGVQIPIVNSAGAPIGSISNIVHGISPPLDWLPPLPPGDDCLDSWIWLNIRIFTPFCEEMVMVPAGFRILRDAPKDPLGLGQEIIATLMAKGLFSGSSSCVGPFTGRVTSGAGEVSSLAPDEFFPADSFFDVFVELDSGIGTLTAGPNHMTTTVNNLPPDPGEIYYGPGTVIPLFDQFGFQIGEIEELHHDIHGSVPCPADCLPRILIGLMPNVPPVHPNPKNNVHVGIPQGANGLTFDVARGPLGALHASGGDFSAATCLAENTLSPLSDPSVPAPGAAFYYVARDVFGAFAGTWNSGGAGQVGNRDSTLAACNP